MISPFDNTFVNPTMYINARFWVILLNWRSTMHKPFQFGFILFVWAFIWTKTLFVRSIVHKSSQFGVNGVSG
jgi:hypothetical protein